ncbi:hypothetical protein ACFL54_08145, partial [Planctomycetota bacterium]
TTAYSHWQGSIPITGKIRMEKAKADTIPRLVKGEMTSSKVQVGPTFFKMIIEWSGHYDITRQIYADLDFTLTAWRSKKLPPNLKQDCLIPPYWAQSWVEISGKGKGRIIGSKDPVLYSMVDNAIAKSREYLLERLRDDKFLAHEPDIGQKNRYWPTGRLSLALFAVLKAEGVAADDPAVLKAVRALANKHRLGQPTGGVGKLEYDKYSPGLLLMASEEFLKKVAKLPQDRVTDDIARLEKTLKLKMKVTLELLIQSFTANTIMDFSNLQYLILGLHAGARAGIFNSGHPKFENTWRSLLRKILKFQMKNGDATEVTDIFANDKNYNVSLKVPADGWGYMFMDLALEKGATFVSGSMTCTGIASVAIAMKYLDVTGKLTAEERAGGRRAILRGLAWMKLNYGVWPGAVAGEWYEYYMYALERAGIIAGFQFIGSRDWYRDGTLALCAQQRANGSWGYDSFGDSVPTAFALLFLKKASSLVSAPK